MTFLSTIKDIKNAMGLGQANFIPGINFGTGTTPAPKPQVLGTQAPQSTPSYDYSGTQSFYTPPASTGGGTGGGITGGNINDLANQQKADVNTSAGEDYDLVNQEYDQALNALAGEENWQRANYSTLEQQARQGGTSAVNRLAESKESQLGAAGEQEESAIETKESGIRSMRDLFRQIQQQNVIDLSGRGLSSSSVAEALAEKLGVETMRRIGDITSDTQTVLNNIGKERTRIMQVFENKKQEVEQAVQTQIQDIQNKLTYALNQISQQRGQAALQKQQARTNIAQWAREQIGQIRQSAFDYSAKLQAAAQKRIQDTEDAIAMLQYNENTGQYEQSSKYQGLVSGLSSAAGGLSQYTPKVQIMNGLPYDVGGQITQKEKSLEEQLAEEAGITS